LRFGDQAGPTEERKKKEKIVTVLIPSPRQNCLTAMDDTLAQVAEKCALQLEMYQKCVVNYPETWDKSCAQQKRALTKCSEEK
jgi:hypothetical protein